MDAKNKEEKNLNFKNSNPFILSMNQGI